MEFILAGRDQFSCPVSKESAMAGVGAYGGQPRYAHHSSPTVGSGVPFLAFWRFHAMQYP